MLHVDPSTAVMAARSAFDPIAYLAYCRACNVPVTIDRHNSEPRLSCDIHDIRADAQLRHHGDPHLDIDADPQGGARSTRSFVPRSGSPVPARAASSSPHGARKARRSTASTAAASCNAAKIWMVGTATAPRLVGS